LLNSLNALVKARPDDIDDAARAACLPTLELYSRCVDETLKDIVVDTRSRVAVR